MLDVIGSCCPRRRLQLLISILPVALGPCVPTLVTTPQRLLGCLVICITTMPLVWGSRSFCCSIRSRRCMIIRLRRRRCLRWRWPVLSAEITTAIVTSCPCRRCTLCRWCIIINKHSRPCWRGWNHWCFHDYCWCSSLRRPCRCVRCR